MILHCKFWRPRTSSHHGALWRCSTVRWCCTGWGREWVDSTENCCLQWAASLYFSFFTECQYSIILCSKHLNILRLNWIFNLLFIKHFIYFFTVRLQMMMVTLMKNSLADLSINTYKCNCSAHKCHNRHNCNILYRSKESLLVQLIKQQHG